MLTHLAVVGIFMITLVCVFAGAWSAVGVFALAMLVGVFLNGWVTRRVYRSGR